MRRILLIVILVGVLGSIAFAAFPTAVNSCNNQEVCSWKPDWKDRVTLY